MNVNKLFIGLILVSFSLFGQKKEVFFLLEEDNPEYIFIINDRKEYSQNTGEAKVFFIISKEEYSIFLKEKNELIKGEPRNISGLTFKVKKEKTINTSDLKKLCLIDYKWLTDNARIKNEQTIELNQFENFYLVLKDEEHSIIYDVVREFSSH